MLDYCQCRGLSLSVTVSVNYGYCRLFLLSNIFTVDYHQSRLLLQSFIVTVHLLLVSIIATVMTYCCLAVCKLVCDWSVVLEEESVHLVSEELEEGLWEHCIGDIVVFEVIVRLYDHI